MTTNKTITIKFMKTEIYQRTNDGFLDFVNAFHFENGRRIAKGLKGKKFAYFFETDENQVWLGKFIEKYGDSKVDYNQLYKKGQKIDIKLLKSLKLYSYRSVKNKSGERMWAHQVLAVKIIGWLNPELDFEIYDIATKELFKNRIVISDMQKQLLKTITENIGKPKSNDFYGVLGHEINTKIYGKSFKGIRDLSTEEEYQAIIKLFNSLIVMIENKIVNSHETVIRLVTKLK